MKKGNVLFIGMVFLLIFCLPLGVFGQINSIYSEKYIDSIESKPSLKVNGFIRDPIIINGDSDFTSENGVVKGNGSANNPYVISNWIIDAKGSDSCIFISETNSYYEIKNCTLFNSGNYWTDAGLYIENSGNAKIYNNIIYNARMGIYLSSSNYNNISGNECFSNNYGIYLNKYNNYNLIHENNCSSNLHYGIYLHQGNNSSILQNNCSSNSYGIYLKIESNTTILENYCSLNSVHGMWLESLSNSTIQGNNCSLNSNIGIMTLRCDNNMISENNCFSHSYYGIHLASSKNNSIWRNNCSSNLRGFDLVSSPNNSIWSNNCSSNRYGIYLKATNNTLWYNIFSDNYYSQVYCENSDENSWYSKGMGNYWGDYQNLYPEASNDGYIWDTPYKINGTADVYDLYPIVSPDGGFLDEIAPFWNQIPTDQTIDVGESFTYDINASDNVGIESYWINNTIYFQIDENGIITDKISLVVDSYNLKVYANDTSGNTITAIFKVKVQDPYPPIWNEKPSNQTIEAGEPFAYDLNASDNVGIDSYWINNTIHFQIDGNGIITDKTTLSLGRYNLRVYVNDTSGNTISAKFHIIVQDTSPPTWNEDPIDQTLNFGESFIYNVNASDNVKIDNYWLNDTNTFNINSSGYITNISTLSAGIYWIEIRAYDASGYYVAKIIKITVAEENIEDPPDDDLGEDERSNPNIGLIIAIGSISSVGLAGGVTIYFKKIRPRGGLEA